METSNKLTYPKRLSRKRRKAIRAARMQTWEWQLESAVNRLEKMNMTSMVRYIQDSFNFYLVEQSPKDFK